MYRVESIYCGFMPLAKCPCCQLDGQPRSSGKPVNGLPMARLVCGLCSRHLGSDIHALAKREREHRAMAAEHEVEALQVVRDAWAAERERMQSEIDQLRTELEE